MSNMRNNKFWSEDRSNEKHCKDCRFLVLPDYDTMMRGNVSRQRCALDGEWVKPTAEACNKFEE